MAQPPQIDSMLVDEAKKELQIFGSFGFAKGSVWVDSVKLQIKNWSDTLIYAAISDTGRGTAGPVVVGGRGYQSESKVLTLWEIGATYAISYRSSFYLEYTHIEWSFRWRADLDSRLRRAKYGLNYFLPFEERYTENYTYHLESNYPGQPPIRRDSISTQYGLNSGKFNLNTLTLYTSVYDNDIVSRLDTNFIPAIWSYTAPNGVNFFGGTSIFLKVASCFHRNA